MNDEEIEENDSGAAAAKVLASSPSGLGGKLAGMSLARQVLALALWPFLQNLLGVGVGLADMMIAGRMKRGVEAEAIMDMMGACMYLMWLLMILQGAMATGALALVARSTGARDMKSANLALGQSLLLGVLSGLLSGVVLWLAVPVIADFFGLGESARAYVLEYMRVACLLAPFSGVLFVASSCLRGYGDTMKPFISMGIVNVVNVCLSIWFVYGLGWGVKGLAAGTVIGWAAGAAFILWILRPRGHTREMLAAGDKGLELVLENLRYDVPMLRRIWLVSWPSMIEIIGMWSVHAVGMHLIGRLKEGSIGAHAMVVRLESISFMPGFAIGMAASALTGQYLGAGDKEMAKKAVRFCLVVAIFAMGGTGLLISYFNTEFLSLFGMSGTEQSEVAAPVIRFVGLLQALTAAMIVTKMAMRGAGATRLVTAYSFGSMWFIRVGVLWAAVHWFEADLLGIWKIMMLDVLVQALIFMWLYLKGDWLKTEV